MMVVISFVLLNAESILAKKKYQIKFNFITFRNKLIKIIRINFVNTKW